MSPNNLRTHKRSAKIKWRSRITHSGTRRRLVEIAAQPQPRFDVRNKLKFLFIAANPSDHSRLRLDEELHEIRKNIRISGNSELIKVFSEWAVRPADLQYSILRYKPHIVHISAHSTKKGGIVFEDDIARDVSIKEADVRGVDVLSLTRLFRTLRGNIKLVFLNSCYTKRQARSISQFVNYTIGMNTLIGDKTSIVFAASFYGWIASGLDINTSFELAVNHLELLRLPRASSPCLFMKEGIDGTSPLLSNTFRAHRRASVTTSDDLKTKTLVRGTQSNQANVRERRKKKSIPAKSAAVSKTEIHSLLIELRSMLERLEAKLSE